MTNTRQLRIEIRQRRREISPHEQRIHSRDAARTFHSSPLFRQCQHLAVYLANDGELNPEPLAEKALSAGKKLYLPVLRPNTHKSLWFAPYAPGDKLISNRFGIPEPDIRKKKTVLPWALDLIIMPLVAFDTQGNRLGIGGGYYDRTLNYLRLRKQWFRPRLAGFAHERQKVQSLPSNPWDIPIHYAITESMVYKF
ncbi:5-formyltetrahydrofolate cyclo-ligase [Solemya velesiana gill symbiont]|uniref:5-formyltetrahydrofolate cyclo-ligase n=1 Tax=Solemya velesiana gill symbiont TaxID=1918948 RepID=A0A1T2KUJ8_9GAMM|nr:5-formyltetrahydrofolate cyclo-ligase [Solemya velesiana gill symbiont]OOZ36527.1 5-formyltetrahydrofolate cyclo-ligase [Solemya velesiana gill symbiont]